MRSLPRRVWRRLRPLPPPESPYPNWKKLLHSEAGLWTRAVSSSDNGPRILIGTSAGGFVPGAIVESMLAVALTLRGAKVHILLCDELLPACIQAMLHFLPSQSEFAAHGPQQHLCANCFGPGYEMYRSLGLPVHRYSDFISADDRRSAHSSAAEIPISEIESYQLDGLAVGEHALAGALRFFASGNLSAEPDAEPILRRYFEASLITTQVTRHLLDSYEFAGACFHHGIYVPQGLIGEVARAKDVRVINWNPAYRKQCFIFSHHDTYHHTLLQEPTANWEHLSWDTQMEDEVMDYLKSRWHGTKDWIWFHEKPEEDLASIAAELGVDFNRPCIGMLTNVMWDAQLHYRANAFPNMLEWVIQTIRYFISRPELQLLIRVHPAEIRGTLPSRQPLVAEIQRVFPNLPKNIIVIPPESQVSTYAAMSQCDTVIIYGTKTGVELTSMGIPTIVAGEAWIRNKGITRDVTTPAQYFEMLDELPQRQRLDERVTERARKYAYHFFFRRMIPLSFMKESKVGAPFRLELETIEQLLPGRDLGLDVICDGIMNGREFIYPAEQRQRQEDLHVAQASSS
ncbi:MAG TPA: hypothetical protein VJ306_01760 [Pyrinomonadaceae bacterium]|nr:hypothetical protein [Pyrinomonadaceae bacterium]